jgi:hypothetical protein
LRIGNEWLENKPLIEKKRNGEIGPGAQISPFLFFITAQGSELENNIYVTIVISY